MVDIQRPGGRDTQGSVADRRVNDHRVADHRVAARTTAGYRVAARTAAEKISSEPRSSVALKRSAGRSLVPLVWAVAGFATIAVFVWLMVFWSVLHPPAVPPIQAPVAGAASLPSVFQGWAHWDASWYTSISRDGYSYQQGATSSVAFFPLYPLAIRLVAAVAPDTNRYILGSLITLAAGLAAAAQLWIWCRDRLPGATATTAVFLLAVYPYSIYLYGPVYGDALFLALTIGAFVLVERDHVVAAAFVGVLASAARPAGLIVAIALVALLIERRSSVAANPAADQRPISMRGPWNPRKLKRRDLVILASPAGFVAYCVFLRARFGDPFAFATVQGAPGWDQKAGLHTWLKIDFFAEVNREPLGPASLGLMLQLGLALAALATVPAIARRIGWSYALLVALIATMPLIATKDFHGTGRYLLPAFPVVALAAHELSRRPRLRAAVLSAGVAVILLFASWFAKGNYLS